MVDVFQPTRSEPFFEPSNSNNPTDWRLTVVWAEYLDGLGRGVNSATVSIEDELAGLESEIKKVSSVQNELVKSLADIEQLATDVKRLASVQHEIDKDISGLDELICDVNKISSTQNELAKDLGEIDQLVSDASPVSAKLAKLQADFEAAIANALSIISDSNNFNARIAELAKRINNLEELVE